MASYTPSSLHLPPRPFVFPARAQVAPSTSELPSAQLSETLRRLGRAVTLASPDPTPSLEAGLRVAGLRDCSEAARAVATAYRLAAMQLLPRSVGGGGRGVTLQWQALG